MIALAMILALLGVTVLVSWLAGLLVRGAPVCGCSSRQGRGCRCMETSP